ncbi:hypothetical protein U1Q18_049774, partial [Sarracenia purpurea var. burkii]
MNIFCRCQGKHAILSTVKKLESDEKQAKGPPIDSIKLANLEAQILRLNKIKASVAKDVACHKQVNLRTGPNDEEARFVVDRNNVAEKYGISKDRSYPKLSSVEQGPLVQFSPEKNEALSTKDPMICGAARVTDKAEPALCEAPGNVVPSQSHSSISDIMITGFLGESNIVASSPDPGTLMEK